MNSVTRLFVSGIFYLLLVPIGMHRHNFEFFRIFVELSVFVIDSLVMNPPGSRFKFLGSKAIFPYINHMSLSS
jgi:hypothetical protein